jgi:hypothetical protein
VVRVIGWLNRGTLTGGFAQQYAGQPLEWRHVTPRILAVQLLIRIVDYTRIEQKSHPLCGLLSQVQDIARRNPVSYVNYVIDLATTRRGSFQVNGQGGAQEVHVRKRSALLNKDFPVHNATKIRAADYIALASLRDSENILPYRSRLTRTATEGGSSAGETKQWMEHAGYSNVEQHTDLVRDTLIHGLRVKDWRVAAAKAFMKPKLLRAQNHLANGRTLILFARSSLGYEVTTGPGGHASRSTGPHAMLCRGIEVLPNDSGVRFDLVTWGRESARDAQGQLLVVPWSKIGSWYYGFVSGEP